MVKGIHLFSDQCGHPLVNVLHLVDNLHTVVFRGDGPNSHAVEGAPIRFNHFSMVGQLRGTSGKLLGLLDHLMSILGIEY